MQDLVPQSGPVLIAWFNVCVLRLLKLVTYEFNNYVCR